MGKSEIVMIVAGIIMSIAIALTIIPAFSKGESFTKTSLVVADINNIKKMADSYVENQSGTGDYKDINAEKLQFLLKGFKLNSSGAMSTFDSSIGSNIKYKLSSATVTPFDELTIEISGLNSIEGVEASVKKRFADIATTIIDTNLTDGIIILKFKE